LARSLSGKYFHDTLRKIFSFARAAMTSFKAEPFLLTLSLPHPPPPPDNNGKILAGVPALSSGSKSSSHQFEYVDLYLKWESVIFLPSDFPPGISPWLAAFFFSFPF